MSHSPAPPFLGPLLSRAAGTVRSLTVKEFHWASFEGVKVGQPMKAISE
jgi:hypothetical protein